MTLYRVSGGHAEKVMECPKGGEHEWTDTTRESIVDSMGHRRECPKCGFEQRWYLVQTPTPENSPRLGRWNDTGQNDDHNSTERGSPFPPD